MRHRALLAFGVMALAYCGQLAAAEYVQKGVTIRRVHQQQDGSSYLSIDGTLKASCHGELLLCSTSKEVCDPVMKRGAEALRDKKSVTIRYTQSAPKAVCETLQIELESQ